MNMNHRLRIIAAVSFTFLITLSIGFVTESIRQSMTFFWIIEEGDEFIFDVKVTGNMIVNSTVLPPPFIKMNNTQIHAEVLSLPNVSIIFYAQTFLEDIVEHMKTSTTFSNGTALPTGVGFIINRLISQSILPIGGWTHLDSFFPNQIDKPSMEHESYLSRFQNNLFYFGYSANETNETQEWHGIIDLETGVPQVVSFWFFRTSQAQTYWYNLTMSLFT